jgi:hypothetical protein
MLEIIFGAAAEANTKIFNIEIRGPGDISITFPEKGMRDPGPNACPYDTIS